MTMSVFALWAWLFAFTFLKWQAKSSFEKIRKTSQLFKSMGKVTLNSFFALTFFIQRTEFSFVKMFFFFLHFIVFLRVFSVFWYSIVSAAASFFSQIINLWSGLCGDFFRLLRRFCGLWKGFICYGRFSWIN